MDLKFICTCCYEPYQWENAQKLYQHIEVHTGQWPSARALCVLNGVGFWPTHSKPDRKGQTGR